MLGVEEDRWRLDWEKSANGGSGGGEGALMTEMVEEPGGAETEEAAAAACVWEAIRLGSGASPWAKSDNAPPALLRQTV